MTEQSFEFKLLYFLNARFELYNITEHTLKIALFDIPENEYNQGMTELRNIGYIKNKDLYEKGITITEQGKIRLQQIQKIVDKEKKQIKTFWERTAPIRDSIGLIGIISAIILGWLNWYGNKENGTLKMEIKSLQDSASFYKKQKEVKIAASYVLSDKQSGHKFIVDEQRIYITAIDTTGKTIWKTDPIVDNKIEEYRVKRPTIVYFAFGSDRTKEEKEIICIAYNNSQFGFIDKTTGKFTFEGQD
jgi:hypothetical protein